MNALVAIAALGLFVLRPATEENSAAKTELAYRSHVGVVTEWRTSMSSDIEFAADESEEVVQKVTMKAFFDNDLTGIAPEAQDERRELLHARRMEVAIEVDGEEAESMVMTRDSIQNGDDVLQASEEPAVDEMLKAMFGEPNMSFRLSPRGVEALMSAHGPALDNAEIADMGLGDEFPLLHPVLPEGPVAVGAKWKGHREIAGEYDFGKQMQVEIEYELVGLADGIATLRAKGRIEAKGPLTAQSDEGEVTASNIVFEQDSEIRFRVAEGVIDTAECSFTFDARIQSTEEGAEAVVMKSSSRIAIARRPPAAEEERAEKDEAK